MTTEGIVMRVLSFLVVLIVFLGSGTLGVEPTRDWELEASRTVHLLVRDLLGDCEEQEIEDQVRKMLYVASEAADKGFKDRKTTLIAVDNLRFVVDVENGDVLGFSRLGEWWPEFQNIDEPISGEMFAGEFVSVFEEGAIRATEDFIEKHFGKDVFSKLKEPSVSKTDFSVGFYYSVVWEDKPNPLGFYTGRLGFRFAVDPVSGKLMRGIFDTVKLQSLPRMSFDDVSNRAEDYLASSGIIECARRVETRVLPGSEDGDFEWRLWFDACSCGEKYCKGLIEIVIDDSDGRLKQGAVE